MAKATTKKVTFASEPQQHNTLNFTEKFFQKNNKTKSYLQKRKIDSYDLKYELKNLFPTTKPHKKFKNMSEWQIIQEHDIPTKIPITEPTINDGNQIIISSKYEFPKFNKPVTHNIKYSENGIPQIIPTKSTQTKQTKKYTYKQTTKIEKKFDPTKSKEQKKRIYDNIETFPLPSHSKMT